VFFLYYLKPVLHKRRGAELKFAECSLWFEVGLRFCIIYFSLFATKKCFWNIAWKNVSNFLMGFLSHPFLQNIFNGWLMEQFNFHICSEYSLDLIKQLYISVVSFVCVNENINVDKWDSIKDITNCLKIYC